MLYSSLREFFYRLDALCLWMMLAIVILFAASFVAPLYFQPFSEAFFLWQELWILVGLVTLLIFGMVILHWRVNQTLTRKYLTKISLGDRLEGYRFKALWRYSFLLNLSMIASFIQMFLNTSSVPVFYLLILILGAIYWPTRKGTIRTLRLKGQEKEYLRSGQ
jgi:hypothetical protein